MAFNVKRVALRTSAGVTYLHVDHLGSTTVASTASGALIARQTREAYAYGAPRTSGTLPTDYTFTGQKVDASAGLMYYGARYYDANIGRFISADTLAADWYNPQLLNRFAYVRNNPIKYTDPTGHVESCGMEGCGGGVKTREEIYRFFAERGEKPWMAEAYAMLHDAEVAKAMHDPNAQSYQEIADALFEHLADPKPVDFTVTVGWQFSGMAGGMGQIEIGLFNLDSEGNLQIGSISFNGGGSTGFGANTSPYIQVTNAKDISSLTEWSVFTGASVDAYFAGGLDWVAGPNHSYDGFQITPGWGVAISASGVPGELHGGASYTIFIGPVLKLW